MENNEKLYCFYCKDPIESDFITTKEGETYHTDCYNQMNRVYDEFDLDDDK